MSLYRNKETGEVVLAIQYRDQMRDLDLLPPGVCIVPTVLLGDQPVLKELCEPGQKVDWFATLVDTLLNDGDWVLTYPGGKKHEVCSTPRFRRTYEPVAWYTRFLPGK